MNIIRVKTDAGKWSTAMIAAFFMSMATFYQLCALEERGGETFFSNPKLAFTILLAAATAFIAFITGMTGIIRSKERSVLVFLATVIGFLVTLFFLGEFTSPH